MYSMATRAGKRPPAARAASTRPALEIIIDTGNASVSESKKVNRSRTTPVAITLITLPFASVLSLRFRSQSVQKAGNAKYARPIREPANKPVTKAANSGAKPNSLKVDEETCSIPINGYSAVLARTRELGLVDSYPATDGLKE